MFKAILFDLDGTLLPLDLEVFLHKYFEMIAPYFADKVEPKLFIKELMAATKEMVGNSGANTNEEVFMNYFLPSIKQEKEIMYPLFEKFYGEEFPRLKKYAGYSSLSANIAGQAAKKGYKIALATNPVFPELATKHRMAWAGIDQINWEVVTTYENCTSCKPNPRYFREVCEKIDVLPENCLMVGNDVQEDLIAGQLGMKTFLVTDYLIDRGNPKYTPDYQGSLADLEIFISQLPTVEA